MSGKTFKRILSVIMSAVIVAGCIVPTFAADKKCAKDDVPLLVISGFSEYRLIDKTTGVSVWSPDTELILDLVERVLPPLTELLASDMTQSDYDALCDEVLPVVNDLFKYIKCTPDGEPYDDNVGLIDQFTGPVSDYNYDDVKNVFGNDIVDIARDRVGADHLWVYGLDWRVDPMILADEIHDYVENMKARTGHDKVAISGISMGGCIMSAYLAKYGYEDLTNITMLSSAFTGLELVGDLFCGKVEIDPQGLYNIITQSIGNSTLSDVLEKTGIVEMILPYVDEIIEYEKDRIYSECLIPAFGYNAGLWSFVPADRYEQAKAFMNPRMNEGTAEQSKAFWAKTDAYHNKVHLKIADILTKAQESGVCVSIISNYNMQMPPVSPASNLTGDQVIETVHTSGFATVAPYGETLGDSYIRNEHLSCDRIIDASTCILPDNTWFIKDEQHVGFSNKGVDDNSKFYGWILVAASDTNIYSNPNFPQFMKYDSENHILSPLANRMGDVNGNSAVTILDAKLVLKAIAGIEKLSDAQAWAADMNMDGNVTISDAKAILKKVAQ